MANTVTYASVPQCDSGVATKPSALSLHTHISDNDAHALWDVIETRADNRSIQRYDAVVTVDEWAVRDQYDVADSRVLLCGSVSDYSEKAYNCRGTFEVDMDEVADYRYINNVVSQVDNTDGDVDVQYGEAYIPKSAVNAIVKVKAHNE